MKEGEETKIAQRQASLVTLMGHSARSTGPVHERESQTTGANINSITSTRRRVTQGVGRRKRKRKRNNKEDRKARERVDEGEGRVYSRAGMVMTYETRVGSTVPLALFV